MNVLNFTVKSELSLVDVAEQPKAKDLFYGDAVVFKYVIGISSTFKFFPL